jgi:hypothetical protein
MALIACSECGRAVSDKAEACIGCGAPISSASAIDLVPKRSHAPPPTREQIKRSALLSSSILAVGVLWAAYIDHTDNRLASLAAALLIIGGLCWLLVVLVQAVSASR